MAAPELNTGDYPDDDRVRLGSAVARARAAAGMLRRKDLAQRAGISLRSLAKLESPLGEASVGRKVLEAVARALPGWTEDTPRSILEGDPAPALVEPAEPDPPILTEPQPQDYPDELEYQNAVYWYLRRGMGMSHEAVMRGFNMAAAIYARKQTERVESDTSGDKLG